MRAYELRAYTLASQADLDFYKDVVYPRTWPASRSTATARMASGPAQ